MKSERFILLLLAACQFIHIVDFMLIMPLGDMIMKDFDINSSAYSVLVASYTISAAVSGVLGAFYLDRFERKKAILFSFGGCVIGTLFCALTPDHAFYTLVASRCVAGAFGGLTVSLVLAIVGDLIPLERRASAMGIVMTAFSIASALGVPFGIYFALHQNKWNAPFLALALLAAFVWLLLLKFLPRMGGHLSNKEQKQPSLRSLTKQVYTNKGQLYALIMMMLLMIGQFTTISFYTPYLIRNVGIEQSHIMYIYLIGGISTLFCSPYIGKLSDKHGKHRVFLICCSLSLIPILIITNLRETPLALVLCVTTSFFILIAGRMVPSTTLVTATVTPAERGGFMSLNTAARQLASGISALLAGVIIIDLPNNQMGRYWLVGIVCVVATVLAMLASLKIRTKN